MAPGPRLAGWRHPVLFPAMPFNLLARRIPVQT
jgi:hypothetical protein